MTLKERVTRATPVVAILFLASCAVESRKTAEQPSASPAITPATATAEVTRTFTPLPLPTRTATPSATATRAETGKPTKTRLLTATPRLVPFATAILPKAEPTKSTGLTNGSELTQDGNFRPLTLTPNQWIRLTITKRGTTDISIRNDPNRQVDAILQSPQQNNQTSKQGEPAGSKGGSCNNLPDCSTIVQARGPEVGQYQLFLHNTGGSSITISVKAVQGEGGCPPGTHDRNDPNFVEPIGGKMVLWPHWCVNDE